MNEQKNLIWAMILSAMVVMLYFTFIEGPNTQKARLNAEAEMARKTAELQVEQGPIVIEELKTREEIIAQGEATRIKIDTPSIGCEIITPSTPVVLEKQVGAVRIQRELSVDDEYLITLNDTLTNTGSTETSIERKGVARQVGLADDLTNFFIIQEGPISVVDGKYHEQKYKKLKKKGGYVVNGEGGWVGLTDKYWLQAAIAPQGNSIEAEYDFKFINNADVYETSYTTAALTLTPGASVTSVGYMMAAPKDYDMLSAYEEAGIGDLTSAIGWGKLKILVKPISRTLSWLGDKLGSLGLGILALTLIIKLLMYPLYSKQYASQAKMKKVQPKLKKLQERYKDDRMKPSRDWAARYPICYLNELNVHITFCASHGRRRRRRGCRSGRHDGESDEVDALDAHVCGPACNHAGIYIGPIRRWPSSICTRRHLHVVRCELGRLAAA